MPKTISYPIRYFNFETRRVESAFISSTCPKCGERRGRPKITQVEGPNGPMMVHRWKNGCKHKDRDDDVIAEIAAQCRNDDCVIMSSSAVHYPFCGEACTVAAAVNIIGDIRSVISQLDSVTEVIDLMRVSVEHPDLDKSLPPGISADGAKALWRANITQTTDAIERAQMALLEAITYGQRGYTMEGTTNYTFPT